MLPIEGNPQNLGFVKDGQHISHWKQIVANSCIPLIFSMKRSRDSHPTIDD